MFKFAALCLASAVVADQLPSIYVSNNDEWATTTGSWQNLMCDYNGGGFVAEVTASVSYGASMSSQDTTNLMLSMFDGVNWNGTTLDQNVSGAMAGDLTQNIGNTYSFMTSCGSNMCLWQGKT